MRYLITLVILCLSITAFSQDDKVDQLIRDGVALHDKGNYKGAVKKYEKALSIDKNNTVAMQEATISYTALKDYHKAIAYCDKLLAMGNVDEEEQIYVNKGTAYDLLGKTNKAIEVYKEGIKKHPYVYLLHFNLAVTYFQNKQIKEAAEHLEQSLTLNPEHTSSNLILAYANYYQNNTVRATLGFLYFLMLEPKSARVETPHKLLQELMAYGVEKKGDNSIQINISPNMDTNDIFNSARIFMSVMAATRFTSENEDKTEFELFHDYTDNMISYLSELKDKDKDNFYVKMYVHFFSKMKDEGHVKAFCHWVTQTKFRESAKWLSQNTDKTTEFMNWLQSYTANNPDRDTKHLRLNPNKK